MKFIQNQKWDQGSIALEYVLVSAFTAIVTFSALKYVTSIIKEKTADLEDKLGIEFDPTSGIDF